MSMKKGREVGDNIFESRYGFGDFGFGRSMMMMPSVFGSRDPFDDPFFSDPFDSFFGPSNRTTMQQKPSKGKGVVIKELGSDDEEGNGDFPDQNIHRSTMEPSVEHPDDDDNEKKQSNVTYKNDHYKVEPPKSSSSSFQTSRVTYGGVDGAYYTSTRTRRTGTDGGHSLLRKLGSDGKLDTKQTLHNLEEDELASFEEAWKGKNMEHGMKVGFDVHRNQGSSGSEQNRNQVWAVPSWENAGRGRGFGSNHETGTDQSGRTKKVVRINIE
ncbi:uncharacterized protein LOC107625954 isoform X2 [Arachis ipaensis]|uniref:uncharacterized protein LOC107625954 isoform X2 n=1 Tax=Arachis ipaensis TaxID=130454 RepID=UPI000A2B41AC|nr:uncharacterized protein LOC107625954 isoform X2 [Arachis ipaensis]XP_025634124.1 uncharacterized protein LOC112728269 isoform X2 [Arachis hypogaea]